MALTYTPPMQPEAACPDFILPAVDGKKYQLSDIQKGNPFVIVFMCNHCPYVQAIEHRLIQLGHDLQKLNVPMIGISSNDAKTHPEDSFEEMKKRAHEKKYSFPYLYDETQEVAKKIGAVCTPDFFVYDHAGHLAYRGRLDDSWKDESRVTQRELYNAVLSLTKKQPVSIEQKSSMGCSIKWK